LVGNGLRTSRTTPSRTWADTFSWLLAKMAGALADRRYRSMAEKMPHIVWTSTAAGNLDYCNQRWFDYTGMTFELSKGSGWQQMLHPDDSEVGSRWSEACMTGGEYEVECRFKRIADGAYRWHLGRASPLRNSAGSWNRHAGSAFPCRSPRTNLRLLQPACSTCRLLTRTLRSGFSAAIFRC
jgi:PAS domain S-box-containing protein